MDLAGADLPGGPTDYLHSEPDFQVWLQSFEAQSSRTTVPDIVELNDRWLLKFDRGSVIQCAFDNGLSLVIASRAGEWHLYIQQPVTMAHPDGADLHVLTPVEGASTETGPVIGLLRAVPVSLEALKDGRLILTFEDASSVTVSAHDLHEAWTLAGPAGLHAASAPGGELAVWLPSTGP